MPRKGDTPFLDLPPLGRKIIEWNFVSPFPVSPKGDSAMGGRPPRRQMHAAPPDKRVFKALR